MLKILILIKSVVFGEEIDQTHICCRFAISFIINAFHGVEPHRRAVFLVRKSRGAVRFGLHLRGIVRSGPVRCGAVFHSLRCGHLFKSCRAVRLSVEELFLSVRLSVHRMNNRKNGLGFAP